MLENRIYNFSAGPSILPEPVLVRAQKELLNYEGSGMSVMEMSHRSKVYDKIICDCQENLRKVMNIPDNYKVLFLQGGASGMFAALPLNLAKTGTADYIVTGNFSGGAFKEGKKYLKDARCAGTTESENFTRIPKQEELTLNPDADYVHICENNTIFGTKWHWLPETGNVPLVADLSSCILSEPVDVTKYGVIYGGAQKNMAPAGIRRDLRRRTEEHGPCGLRGCDRPGGSAGKQEPSVPEDLGFYNTGGQELHDQYASDLFDLYLQACA